MTKFLLSATLFLFVALSAKAQEVNATIRVDYSKLPTSDAAIFERMEEVLNEFVNNRRWTKDQYSDKERIEFSILITLSEGSSESFKGTMQVQSRRPVYNSGYYTNVLSHQDEDVAFNFSQFAVLEYSENSFMSNLSSLIAFYTYMVIGYDYDTFSQNGGTEYFNKARNIVQYSQSAGGKGWQSSGKRNRYWLVENHLNPRFAGLRSALYAYHRSGMDQMSESPEKGREGILNALKAMEKVHTFQPNSYNAQVFFTAKYTELVKVFQEAEREEQDAVLELLTKIDPGNLVKYQKIKD